EVAASHVQCALHMNRAIAAIACFILIGVVQAQAAPSRLEQQLFDLINHEREKAGLNKLEWSDQLANAARDHSRLMDEHQDLSHQFAGEPGLQQRLGATGARFNSVAENVAEAREEEAILPGPKKGPSHG